MRGTSGPLGLLRALCLAEALTLLVLLLVAVPLKHLGGHAGAVSLMGPVHGLAFVAFCWALVQAVAQGSVGARQGWRLLWAAFLPFGGLFSWAALGRAGEGRP